MKLIIGLGNPEEEYKGTRHNVGRQVVEKIARQIDAEFKLDKKSNAEVAKGKLNGRPVILAKPQGFVNNSGVVVKKLIQNTRYKIQDTVIIHDDLDIKFGNFKFSFGKNSGGHRGVESIIKVLKTNQFWRLKIGTANGKLAAARRTDKVANFVLSKFTPAEQEELKKVIKHALERLTLTFR